jgi:hypothetical protein
MHPYFTSSQISLAVHSLWIKPLQQLWVDTINLNVSVWTDAHTVQYPCAMKHSSVLMLSGRTARANSNRKATNMLEREFLSLLSVHYYIHSTGLQTFYGKGPQPLLWAG